MYVGMEYFNLISYLRLSAFICGSFLVLLFTAAMSMAQHGGKAEPNQIEFKRGTNSTTISGVVHGDEQAEYTFSAKKGQRLIIRMTNTPTKSSCFDLKGPEGADVGLEYNCNWNYSKLLPETGEYFLSVGRTSQGKGTSRYTMTITIK